MLSIFLCWLYIFLTSVLSGYIFFDGLCAFFKFKPISVHPLLASLVGLLPIMVLLGFWSLFFGMGMFAHIFIIGLLFISYIWRRPNLMLHFNQLKFAPLSLIVMTLIFLLILFKSAQGITTPDSGSYHLPFIKWIEQYKVIPGLGNVQTRFGFDYQYHILCAFYGVSFMTGETLHGLNGYLQCLVILYLIASIRMSKPKELDKVDLTKIMVAFFMLNMGNAASSFSPDFPTTSLVVILILLFYELIETENFTTWNATHLLIYLFCLQAILFKISAIPVGLLIFFILYRMMKGGQYKAVAGMFIFSVICILPFLIRNYFISGYLIYPFYKLDVFDVAWKIPYERAVYEKEVIRYYALGLPYETPFTYKEMIVSWLKYLKQSNTMYLAVIACLVFAKLLNLTYLIKLFIEKNRFVFRWILFFGILYTCLAYWFFNAPDPRFGNGYIFPFIAMNVSVFVVLFFKKHIKIFLQVGLMSMALICLISFKGVRLSKVSNNFSASNHFYLTTQANYPIPDTFRRTDELSHVFYKVKDTGYCWQSALPCAFLSDSFTFRTKNIEDGFLPVYSK